MELDSGETIMTMIEQEKHSFWNRLAMTVGTALIIAFFSELFFMNEGPTADLIASFSTPLGPIRFVAGLAMFYSLFVLWLLIPIDFFNVRSVWALFLSAALCGWAIEGMVIPVMYTDLPYSIFWPSVAWHGLVNVFLGWWLLRRLLQRNNYGLTAVAALGMGLFWGFWATWFWAGNETAPILPADFTPFVFAATLVLMLGYGLIDRFGGTVFKPSKTEIGILLVISVVFWAISNIGVTPLQLVLPVLVIMLFAVLRRNRKLETRANFFSLFAGPHIKLANLALLLLMPIAASLTYPFYFHNNISFSENWLLLLPMIGVSVVWFCWSFVKILQQRHDQPDQVV
jgi:hypothetical protein